MCSSLLCRLFRASRAFLPKLVQPPGARPHAGGEFVPLFFMKCAACRVLVLALHVALWRMALWLCVQIAARLSGHRGAGRRPPTIFPSCGIHASKCWPVTPPIGTERLLTYRHTMLSRAGPGRIGTGGAPSRGCPMDLEVATLESGNAIIAKAATEVRFG